MGFTKDIINKSLGSESIVFKQGDNGKNQQVSTCPGIFTPFWHCFRRCDIKDGLASLDLPHLSRYARDPFIMLKNIKFRVPGPLISITVLSNSSTSTRATATTSFTIAAVTVEEDATSATKSTYDMFCYNVGLPVFSSTTSHQRI
ncbi:hypothetical protein CBL_11973 [Carabus blaptoides fortunei]